MFGKLAWQGKAMDKRENFQINTDVLGKLGKNNGNKIENTKFIEWEHVFYGLQF